MPSWNPPHFTCKDCGIEIWSRFPGDFVACDCPGDNYVAVDQTEWYCRYIGDVSKLTPHPFDDTPS